MKDKDQKLIYENMYGQKELLNEPDPDDEIGDQEDPRGVKYPHGWVPHRKGPNRGWATSDEFDAGVARSERGEHSIEDFRDEFANKYEQEEEWEEFHDPAQLNAKVKGALLDIEDGETVDNLVQRYAHQMRELAGEADLSPEEGGSSTAEWWMINDLQEQLLELAEDLAVEGGGRPPADYGADEFPHGDAGMDPKFERVIRAIKNFSDAIDKLRPRDSAK